MGINTLKNSSCWHSVKVKMRHLSLIYLSFLVLVQTALGEKKNVENFKNSVGDSMLLDVIVKYFRYYSVKSLNLIVCPDDIGKLRIK